MTNRAQALTNVEGVMMAFVPPKAAPLVSPVEPIGFRAAGKVVSARILEEPPPRALLKQPSVTQSQRAGKRYERRAVNALVGHFKVAFKHPWMEYTTSDSQRRLCQPDFLALTNELAIIGECKLAHTIYSWWQLRHLYGPVVSAMCPDRRVVVFEMTRWLDVSVGWPEQIELITKFEEIEGLSKFGVLQWK